MWALDTATAGSFLKQYSANSDPWRRITLNCWNQLTLQREEEYTTASSKNNFPFIATGPGCLYLIRNNGFFPPLTAKPAGNALKRFGLRSLLELFRYHLPFPNWTICLWTLDPVSIWTSTILLPLIVHGTSVISLEARKINGQVDSKTRHVIVSRPSSKRAVPDTYLLQLSSLNGTAES